MVTGPNLSQFWLPLTECPSGVSTSSCRAIPRASSGRASRRQAFTGNREATRRASSPTTAKAACLRKIENAESVRSMETMAEADRTMMRPKTTSAAVTQTSR